MPIRDVCIAGRVDAGGMDLLVMYPTGCDPRLLMLSQRLDDVWAKQSDWLCTGQEEVKCDTRTTLLGRQVLCGRVNEHLSKFRSFETDLRLLTMLRSDDGLSDDMVRSAAFF